MCVYSVDLHRSDMLADIKVKSRESGRSPIDSTLLGTV